MPPIRLKNNKLAAFYDSNPQFQVQTFDFNNPASLNQIAWDSLDQEEILALLKSYQRLLKLHPDEQAADLLLARGFTSAHQIAQLPEQRFAREMRTDLNAVDAESDGARLALSIHRNARAVQTGTRLLALDAQVASQAASIPGLAHLQDRIPFHQGMPSYERLFGRNVYAVDKNAQTIFSPAAYFVDLMNLIDQYITQANADTIPAGLTLQERRPDLWQIKLDADSTYTELPYIEIVNQILETKLRYDLGQDPRKYIANAVYPFKLPANLPLDEIRAYLAPFKQTLAEIYQAYRVTEQQVARESLGLSLESNGLITGNPSVLPDGTTTPTVSDAYGLYESQTTDDLSYQKLFLEKTRLTSQQLNDLINQNTRAAQTNALSFDGVDDYGTCSNSTSLQVTGNQTIEMWLNAAQWGTTSIFWKAADGEFAVEENNSGTLYYMFGPTGSSNSSSEGQTLAISANMLPLNEWVHIAIVRDWENKQVIGYINGVVQSNSPQAITVSEIAASTGNVSLATGWDSKYNGQMAEVRLWNIVRSQEEIQADMNRRLTGREPGLAAYWPLDKGSGSTAHDLSPNNNTMTLSGNPAWSVVNDLPFRDNELNSALMHGLFINSALADNQYLCLTPGRIQVRDDVAPPSNPDDATLERLQSFIRLAGQLGWTYADLDWTLRSLGATSIDDAAMKGVALVKQLQAQLQQPLDVLCSLWADLKTIGLGAQAGPPQDLFDRVFNLPDTFYSPSGHQHSWPYHPSYSANPLYHDPVQSWYVNSTSADPTYATDTQFRSRLMAALQLNDSDLTALAHYLCDQGLLVATDLNGAAQNAAEYTIGLTVQNLTLLYRYSKLAQLLKLSLSDFLNLLPMIGQPSITSLQDALKVCGWARWLKQAGLSVPQLSYITTGAQPRPIDQAAADQAIEGMLNALTASSQGVMVTPAALLTGGMSQAQAQTLFDDLVTQGFINSSGLVLHERPLSYQSLAALVPEQTGDSTTVALPPHETSPVQPPAPEAVKETVGLHVEAVLRAYLARQNLLVTKTLANSFRATPVQMESATLLTELIQPSSLTFDGTDDYCEVSYASVLNPPVFTLSCWVKVAQTSNWQSIVTSRMAGGMPSGYIIYVSPTDPPGQGFTFWLGDGSQFLHLIDNSPVVSEWTHIAVTYDGANMNLYLNGKPSASGPFACSDFVPNPQYPLRIGTGCTEGPPNLFFGGEISDMRLWNKALTAARIQAEMYSREPQNTSHLAAWWPIKAGSGSTLYDWSLNGHDGPLYEYANGTTSELSDPNWNNYHLNQLLNPLQPGAALPQSISDFLTLTTQNLALIKALKLTSYEVIALIRNPAPFGINGIGPGFAFTPEQIRTIWEFKQLCKAFNDTSNQLLAYFAAPTTAALAQITGWNEDQITTLEAYLGALDTEPVTSFDSVAGVAALKRCFDVSLTLGVSIDYVLNTLLPLSDLPVLGAAGVDNWTLYETTAASVKQVLLKHYKPELLQTALASLQGPLQEQLRDCLSRLLIWELGETFAGIKTEQDLYEFLLTDVQTSSVVQLSYLKEGLNALQLYVQRCLTNLENGVTNTIPRAWWAWMDSYRVWQANREVYLYPENYVDPTLRKLQSSQFKDFSTQLMQGQLTDKLVAESYASYMDAVQELANLRDH